MRTSRGLILFVLSFALPAWGEYGVPLRPSNSGQNFDGHVVYRAAAAQTSSSSSYLTVGRAWNGTHYVGMIKSALVNSHGFPNGNFNKSNGWNPGEQVYDFAGAGLDNLCNSVVYAYDGFIAACRSMTSAGYYNIFLIKVNSSGNVMTSFGNNGIVDTGLGGSSNHAFVRGIAYNSNVNSTNHGVVAIVGATGTYSPGHFTPFIQTYDQSTGAAYTSVVSDTSIQGSAVAVAYDASSNAYYMASTETAATNHFYVEKYFHDGTTPTLLDTDSTHSWDRAVDFTKAISGGAAHSIPSTVAIFGTDVIVGGANKVSSISSPWRCAVVALSTADGTLDTSFGSVPLTGGTNSTGITLFSHETTPADDCIINQVLPTTSQLVVTGSAYTQTNVNYDYLTALLTSSGSLVSSYGNGAVPGTEVYGLGPADDVLNAAVLVNSGSHFVSVGRSSDSSGYQGGDSEYFAIADGGIAPVFKNLSVTPSLTGVPSGNTATSTVTVKFDDGTSATIPSSSFNWNSDNSTSLSVNTSGTIIPATGPSAIGAAGISASLVGVSNKTNVNNPGFVETLQGTAQGTGIIEIRGVATDSSNNVLVTGITSGGMKGTIQTDINGDDFFIAKYNSSGTLQWFNQMGNASNGGLSMSNSVATDSTGNVVIAGYTTGGINGSTQTGSEDLFVKKYNASGTVLWTRQMGATSNRTRGLGVAIDSLGNSLVVGDTGANGSSFTGLNGNTTTGNYDLYVAKYDGAGSILWVKQLGAANAATTATSVSVDSNNNVFVSGYTSGGLNGNTMTGGYDFFLAKYDSLGNLSWVKQMGSSGKASYAYGIKLDTSDNIVVTGYTSGGLNGNIQSGNLDLFASKYDNQGNLQWLIQTGAGSGQLTSAMGISTDLSNNIFVVGRTSGGLYGNAQSGTQDLFVAKYSSAGSMVWLKQMGAASNYSGALCAATDSAGNVLFGGTTSAGLNGNIQTAQYDFIVGQYNPSGSLQWLRQMGGNASSVVIETTVTDGSGNIFVAGSTKGALSGNTAIGNPDLFIGKFNSSGTLQWTSQTGASGGNSYAYGVALDRSGNIVVAGTTTGGLNGNTQKGTYDFFVAKYDSSGTLLWLNQMGKFSSTVPSTSMAYGVATDSSGNVFVAGYTSVGLNGNTQTGSEDLFIAKYNSSGALQWLKQVGVASGSTEAQSISIDSSGDIFVAGFTSGGLNGNTQKGNDDYFVAEFNSSGTLQWLKQNGVPYGYTYAYGVATDSSGNVLVTGATDASAGLSGNTQKGTYDYFVAKYNSSGTLQWLKQNGKSSSSTYARSVSTDSSGNVLIAGDTSGALNGSTQTGTQDMFVAQYNSSGTLQWLNQVGYAAQKTYAYGVSTDSSNNVFVGGTSTGMLDTNSRVGVQEAFLIKYNSSGLKQ